MITKKDIPLDLLKIIEPIAQANLDLIKFKSEANTYYCFVEVDSKSNNYFKIYIDGNKIIGNYESSKYVIDFKPKDTSNATNSISQTSLVILTEKYVNWLKSIRQIHEMQSVHDDNFEQFYSNFYYNEFKIIDEDANLHPFDPNQQEYVEIYLSELTRSLKHSGEILSEKSQIEIINDIETIQILMPSSTKNQVMKAITKVYGKIFKLSKELGKEIVKDAKKQLISKLVEYGIQYGPKLIEIFTNNNLQQNNL